MNLMTFSGNIEHRIRHRMMTFVISNHKGTLTMISLESKPGGLNLSRSKLVALDLQGTKPFGLDPWNSKVLYNLCRSLAF